MKELDHTEDKGKEDKQVQEAEQTQSQANRFTRNRVLSWIHCIVNVGLICALIYMLVPTIMTYQSLEKEEQYIEEKKADIDKLQNDIEQNKETYADVKEQREQLEKEVEKAKDSFQEQYGRSYEDAMDLNYEIWLELCDENDSFIEKPLKYDFFDRKHPYWIEFTVHNFDQSKNRELYCINVYRGVEYEKEESELCQTILQEKTLDEKAVEDIYVRIEDCNFDLNMDVIVQCDVGEEDQDGYMQYEYFIYLWDA